MASASSLLKVLPLLVLAISLGVQAGFDQILCEDLARDECAFAVSSNGQRCIMEKSVKRSGMEAVNCRGSFIYASDSLKNWIESEHCIRSCGLDRNTFGISSDSLMQNDFVQSLCSPPCMDACPNVVDLYFNLAAGEGASLANVCEAQKAGGLRRGLAEFLNFNLAQSPAAVKVERKLIFEADAPTTAAVSRFAIEEAAAQAPAGESGGFDIQSKLGAEDVEAHAAESPDNNGAGASFVDIEAEAPTSGFE